jgi:uncharacterized protein (TIGR03437 family)
MPTQLDQVSATVNGKTAFIYYISPLPVNILTPPDALSAPAPLQVTYNGVTGCGPAGYATGQANWVIPVANFT